MLRSITIWEFSRSNRQHVPNEKRKKRPVRKLIKSPDVPLPQVWDQFIALKDNKADLATILFTELLHAAESMSQNCEIITGGGFPEHENATSNKREITTLWANH